MAELTWLKRSNLLPMASLSMYHVLDLTLTQRFKQRCWHRRGAVISQRDGDPHFTHSSENRLKQLMDQQEEAGAYCGECA